MPSRVSIEEFEKLATPLGCILNPIKTRILTSTNGESALPSIAEAYGSAIALQVFKAICKYSYSECTAADGTTYNNPVEVTTGLRLLGHPVGSLTFAKSFFAAQIAQAEAGAAKLLEKVPDHQTALCLFAQCTLHKTPHLLGSEVMHCFQETNYERWDDWSGPLSCR